MSDSSPEKMPTVDDCFRLLTRRSVPNGQIQLYQALLAAGSEGATTAELVSTMGRRDADDFNGVLGALGNRINGTSGYGQAAEPGIEMILAIGEADEGYRYHLKPVMREALAAHAPSWLPDISTTRHLVGLVRSRFPGWSGFEDPRFNQGPLDEVGYKLVTVRKAERLLPEETVRRLIEEDDYGEIIDRLISLGGDNNLLYAPKLRAGDLTLLHHDDLDRPGFCHAFVDLLYGDKDTPTRLDRYSDWVSSQGLDSMNRWALPTYFLFFLDSENEVFVKPQATRNLLELCGSDVQFEAKPTGNDYARIRDAYVELREALARYGYGPRHMIDVQSLGWVAQEEEERQRRARQNAEAEDFVLKPRVEKAIKEFERTVEAGKLIDQAKRIEQARRDFAETFGSAAKLRSLSAEAWFDFFIDVDAGRGSQGIFALNVAFSKDPAKVTFQRLQEDLPTLREALTRLLHGGGTPAASVDAMWDIGEGVRTYVTKNLTVASALLFIQGPEKAAGVLPMEKKEEKLLATGHMPEVPETATLGERFEAFERTLNALPERYGRNWPPEARKEFYFSEAFESLKNGPPPPPPPPTRRPSYRHLIESLQAAGLHFSEETVANYVLALQTKRFAILTGISGTGKTQIATHVVERKLDNVVVVPVRPDWVDNRGLLGYLNPITGAYSMTPFLSLLLEARDEERRADKDGRDPHPFFVVLDEMNLARVEHYFSDFLSALESDEPIPLHDNQEIEDGAAESGVPVPRQLWIPENVFFTGTVNVDETTYMFSPKVLDRAFTIEFDRVDLAGYTDGVARREPGELDLSAGKDGGLRFTPYEKPNRDDWLEFSKFDGGRYHRILLRLHAILEEEHRHFGYRVANEIARFVNLAREQSANGDGAAKAAFDLALLQKVLPKFHGTEQELGSVLKRLFNFAVHGGERRRRDTDVSLDEWMVVDGRLTPSGRAASSADVPTGTAQSDTDGSVDETEGPGSENETDADAGDSEKGPDPEFPRTAAKIWRMLRRLRQRGFAAFIE